MALKRIPRRASRSIPQERTIALQIAAAAQETKAESLLLYDLQNRSPITDFVLICSGRSQAHVRGIRDRIEERMKARRLRPRTVEGYQEGSWVVMDYDVVIVHVFHPETRLYYDLESLLESYPHEALGAPPETGAKGAPADHEGAASP
jgi:ribosome-associated protein